MKCHLMWPVSFFVIEIFPTTKSRLAKINHQRCNLHGHWTSEIRLLEVILLIFSLPYKVIRLIFLIMSFGLQCGTFKAETSDPSKH